jgi:hypothetical protein
MKKIELSGQVFGSLSVIKEDGRTNDGKVKWLCECDCGRTASVNGRHLRGGKIKSCGCLQFSHSTTHGMSKTRTFAIWAEMRARCNNPNRARWADYGGRGIKVSDRWDKFENFYADMGDAPDRMSIDRIDVNGDYCPANCRWATPKEQANNRRNNVFLTWQNKTQTIAQWSEETGVPAYAISHRLSKSLTLDDVFAPVEDKKIMFHGENKTLSKWARSMGISQAGLWNRIYKLGWSPERALTAPPQRY